MGSTQFSENSGMGRTTLTPSIAIPAPSNGASSVGGNSGIQKMSNLPSLLDSSGQLTAAGRISLPPEMRPSVTVNIGIAGDPEATARAIVDTVNNSNYRGTGGANRFVYLD